ncbi:hypothetical protein [Pedobacter frigoris]|uniref:hypothetical protein n=1 Tax=Pedobacter frigoris TaxID=2571272 RepID=UPI002930064E|nr:hypothetical protein [Pedobacter frigoris]
MEKSENGKYEVILKNDVFYIDFERARLVLKDDPGWGIPYEHMYFRNGQYEFWYDPKEQYVHVPFEDAKGVVMVILPLLIDVDRKATLSNYGLKDEEITIKELQALRDQEAPLMKRVLGDPAMIEIDRVIYSIDIEQRELSTRYGIQSKTIPFRIFHEVESGGALQFLYEKSTGNAYPVSDLDFRYGQNLFLVTLPALEQMDPVGVAISQGRNMLDLIWRYPQPRLVSADCKKTEHRLMQDQLKHGQYSRPKDEAKHKIRKIKR